MQRIGTRPASEARDHSDGHGDDVAAAHASPRPAARRHGTRQRAPPLRGFGTGVQGGDLRRIPLHSARIGDHRESVRLGRGGQRHGVEDSVGDAERRATATSAWTRLATFPDSGDAVDDPATGDDLVDAVHGRIARPLRRCRTTRDRHGQIHSCTRSAAPAGHLPGQGRSGRREATDLAATAAALGVDARRAARRTAAGHGMDRFAEQFHTKFMLDDGADGIPREPGAPR